MMPTHENKILKRRIKFWWLLPLAFGVGLYVAPHLQATKDVTVLLKGCLNTDCELKGDLRVSFITGDYTLRQSDGTEVTFTKDQIAFIQLPD